MTSTVVSTRTSLASAATAAARPQFGLLAFLALTAACAVFAAWLRLLESSPWLPEPVSEADRTYVTWLSAFSAIGFVCGLLRSRGQQFTFLLAMAASVALLVVEVFSATACWYVFGEVLVALHWFIMPVVLIPPLLCACRRFRASLVASWLIASLTLPAWGSQLVLVPRLNSLHAEIGAIVEYAESTKAETGAYPLDLGEYRFRRAALAPRIEYYVPDGQPGQYYMLIFKLYDGDNTTREYSPGKGWYYYPD